MHVLWVSDFRTGVASGATSQAELCGIALKKSGVDVTFCQTPPLAIRGEKYVKTETKGVPLLYPARNMMDTVREVDPDVVMLHCFTDQLLTELPDLVRAYPTAVRVGINILELLVTPGYPRIIPQTISFMQMADHIVAASENTRHACEGLGCRSEDITVIHTAIDPKQFKVSNCTDPTIAVLGRVFPVKNHLTLLQAVKLIRKDFPKVELAISGEGRLTSMYQQLISLLLLDTQVKITGYMDDLSWLFREVSISALPSISENMPACVLESYASGIPCVLSDCGWGDTFQAALKAKHDSPREWADQLLRLLKDRKFYLKIRDRQFDELRKFTVEQMIPKYITLFQKLCELNKYKVKKTNPRVKQ
jgi:glycosyltransferase involved in cell wall biosynthesis